jgi:GDP-mannose 6-dehydrogenase
MTDDVDAILQHGETIVVGNSDPELQDVIGRLRSGQRLVDFVRLAGREKIMGIITGYLGERVTSINDMAV